VSWCTSGGVLRVVVSALQKRLVILRCIVKQFFASQNFFFRTCTIAL
jgi:hypothetical protein